MKDLPVRTCHMNLLPVKIQEPRVRVLENAGKLKIPITTGLLIGIGETLEEIVDSLIVIREINQKYGNIQEVIMQNHVPKDNTKMKNFCHQHLIYFCSLFP